MGVVSEAVLVPVFPLIGIQREGVGLVYDPVSVIVRVYDVAGAVGVGVHGDG